MGAIALLYPPMVRVRATVKLSAAFFHDESSITIGGGERKCNSAEKWSTAQMMFCSFIFFIPMSQAIISDINKSGVCSF